MTETAHPLAITSMHAFTRDQALYHPSVRISGWPDGEAYLLFRSQEFDYLFVASELSNGHVLDWGCNNGYGTQILAEKASVIGIDVSDRLVNDARRRNPSITFEQIDGIRTNFSTHSFDAVVMLQVLEHLPEPIEVLREIRRILRPDGRLYVSTPNEAARLAGEEPWNPFHVAEYDAARCRKLLGQVFPEVHIVGLHGTPDVEAIEQARWERRRVARGLERELRRMAKTISDEHSTDELVVDAHISVKVRFRDPARIPTVESILALEERGELFFYSEKNLERAISLLATCA